MESYNAKQKLTAAAESFYHDEQFSDFTIACEGREFKVHRCFIVPHSKFFEIACSGMFTETQQRRIDLKEDDPDMVELMVKFFYTFDYAMPDKSEASHLDLHTRVYTIADRYEVLDLKAMAMQRFRKGLRCKNGQAMIQAARVLEEIMPLPICDTTLHDLVIRGLDWGGEALFADIGETGVSSLFKEISWLSAALATRVSYRLDRREKSIQYIRHCLQKAFLSRHQAPKEEEMYAMSKWLSKLLKFEELESSIIRATKIHKVLKAITKLVSIPKDEIFGLKRRSAELFKIYHERVESADEAVEPSPGQRWLMSLPPATTAKAKNAKRKA